MKVIIDIPEEALCALWLDKWGEKRIADGSPSPSPEDLCRSIIMDAASDYTSQWEITEAQLAQWRSTLKAETGPASPWMTKAEVCAYFRRPEKWVDFWCHPDRNKGAIPAMPRIGAVSNKGEGRSATASFYAPDVAEYLLKYHKT